MPTFTLPSSHEQPEQSRTLIEKLDGRSVLYQMAHRVFRWQASDLAEILLFVLDLNLDAPKICVVDTEFYQTEERPR